MEFCDGNGVRAFSRDGDWWFVKEWYVLYVGSKVNKLMMVYVLAVKINLARKKLKDAIDLMTDKQIIDIVKSLNIVLE